MYSLPFAITRQSGEGAVEYQSCSPRATGSVSAAQELAVPSIPDRVFSPGQADVSLSFRSAAAQDQNLLFWSFGPSRNDGFLDCFVALLLAMTRSMVT